MLRPSIGGDVLDVETGLREPVPDRAGARLVRFARWIDRRNPHEFDRERDDLVHGAIDLGDDAIGWCQANYNTLMRAGACSHARAQRDSCVAHMRISERGWGPARK